MLCAHKNRLLLARIRYRRPLAVAGGLWAVQAPVKVMISGEEP
jgi:hypothetical protein